MLNPNSHHFYVSKSGRQYVHEPSGALWNYDREVNRWMPALRTLEDVIAEGRLFEVPSPDDFVFYARKAYLLQFVGEKDEHKTT